MLLHLIRLARPHHWVKNAFVLVPVPFALAHGASFVPGIFVVGLIGFSLVASAVYVINDLRDAEADRLNPAKRGRPLASGTVSPQLATGFAVSLLAGGLGAVAWAGSTRALVVTLVYFAINVGYSFGLKHIPLLDVFLLASGFLIRVLVGCALLDVRPSTWLLICASALALFLSFTKRRADVVAGVDVAHRPALAGYNAAFLDQAMSIMCGVALLAYTLYSVDAAGFVTGRELTGMPFVAFALLHYLRVAYTENRGASPVELALRSIPLQLCAVGWLIVTVWSLGIFGG